MEEELINKDLNIQKLSINEEIYVIYQIKIKLKLFFLFYLFIIKFLFYKKNKFYFFFLFSHMNYFNNFYFILFRYLKILHKNDRFLIIINIICLLL